MSIKHVSTRFTTTASLQESKIRCHNCWKYVSIAVPDNNGRVLCLDCNPQAKKDDLIRLAEEDAS